MANTKGNAYPLWFIGENAAIYAIDSSGHSHKLSDNDFAMQISLSEDGTVWVLSNTPDPDGGGARIFWGNGDNNWNEISTSDPGGVGISGATGSKCIYLTSDDEVYTLDTNGAATKDFSGLDIREITYGGGYLWAIMPEHPGGIPILRYLKANDATKNWTSFQGNLMPSSIRANYDGNCFGVLDLSPTYFSNNGSGTGSAGGGLDGKAIQMAARNWNYALSTDGNEKGNLIYEWVDTSGGFFSPLSYRGVRIAASYYRKS